MLFKMIVKVVFVSCYGIPVGCQGVAMVIQVDARQFLQVVSKLLLASSSISPGGCSTVALVFHAVSKQFLWYSKQLLGIWS